MTYLPTADEMLDAAEHALREANRALGDAADWLRSDWRPVGSSLTADQAARRIQLRAAISGAKEAINNGLSR
jgi:hypothetical protein